MAFFKKLKDRLFKSSSKIEDGLDAIVEDGGVEEDIVTDQSDADAAVADVVQADAESAELAAQAERDAQARLAEEAARQEAAAVEAKRVKEEAEKAEAARIAAEREAEELAAAAAADANARAAAEAAKKAAQEAAQEAVAQAARAKEAELAEIAAREEADRKRAQADREAEERAAQEAAQAEADRIAAAENAAKLEAENQAELERAAKAKQDKEAAAKPGLLGRLLGRGDKRTVVRRELDDDMLEQLEELLISSDMGVDTALRVTANMAEGRFGKRLSTDEIKGLLATEVTRIMEPVARPMPLYPSKPQVVLVVGVNGSGKTTTIGKLASQFQAAGKKVVIAAGDTFRAAAVEQLQVWGERAGVPVLTAPEGSDPASLAYDAMEQAARDNADLLMIDTAGRLQNRSDLMEELSKIVRVIRKKDPDAPHNTLLVLDATTGQNALSQVKTFQELADVTGLVMTKLDGTAKGGVLVALADKFGLPIHAIGVGEQIDDLAPFDPEDFAAALIGTDR